MFKKTLLAASLLATFGASAATITPGAPQTLSVEGSQSAATPTVTVNHTLGVAAAADISVVITSAADYIQNDVISITFTGATVDVASSAILETNADALITASLIDIVDNVIRFRVDADIASGTALYLSGVDLDIDGATAATEISVTSVAISSSNAIGSYDAGAAVVVADFASQLSNVVDDAFDGIIDVENDRATFDDVAVVNGDPDDAGASDLHLTTQDSFVITVSDDGGKQGLTFDAGSLTIQAEDLSAYADQDADEDGILTAAEMAGEVGITSINLATNVITTAWAFGDLGAAYTVSLPSVTSPQVLAEQTFTASVTATDTGVASATNSAIAAGSWSLNGSVVTVPYMPFGDNTQVIMRQTVTGTQSGDLSVRYMLEGVDTAWNTVGVVTTATPGVTNIADLVMDAIKADAGVTKGKVAIEITSNVPTANVNVYASYKVLSETDRGFVGNF